MIFTDILNQLTISDGPENLVSGMMLLLKIIWKEKKVHNGQDDLDWHRDGCGHLYQVSHEKYSDNKNIYTDMQETNERRLSF